MANDSVLSFQIDHRDNPGLHNLYVGYAMEELEVIEQFIHEMEQFSRVTASILAGGLKEKVAEQCKLDAAWFEAAGRRYAWMANPNSGIESEQADADA
jgi:hypothetical protein